MKVKKSEIRRLIAVYETKAEMYSERADGNNNCLEESECNALATAYYEVSADLHELLGDVMEE